MPMRLRRLFPLLALALYTASIPLGRAQPAAPTAASPSAQARLGADIDAVLAQPRFKTADWGIAVVSLDSGQTLYAHRAHHLLEPASTAKLYTAALALETLGANTRIATRLLAHGTQRGGRFDGTLVLYGMGDPALGTSWDNPDWADQLADQLAARGVRRVHGDLVADDRYFAGPLTGSGWEVDDTLSWFAAPASALSVQENTAQLTVMPAARAGRKARVSLDPVKAIPALVNRIATVPAGIRDDINLYRAPGRDTLYAFGRMAVGASARTFRLAMVDPARVAATQLRRALTRKGIHLDGRVRVLHWPEPDDLLLKHTRTVGEVLSPPLAEILRSGLKRSQNLYLQNLLLIAGVQAQTSPSPSPSPDPPDGFLTTEAWGLRAMRALLDRIGLSPDAVNLHEGSGLSRQDLTTPAALVRLLKFLAARPYADQLRDALPVAGVDGTLAWRMRNTAAAGNVHAKTGSMTYVNCLAGYVTTATGEHLAFAIMLNNYEPPEGAPHASLTLDAIASRLAEYRGPH